MTNPPNRIEGHTFAPASDVLDEIRSAIRIRELVPPRPDMNCVYRASSVEQADIVVAWLEEQGIPAFVKNRNMAANYVALAVAPRGVEVCVLDPDLASKAEGLLKTHFESIKAQTEGRSEKVIPVLCGECGQTVEFPGELFGTVQSCPSCGRNVDVGDPPQFC